MLIVKALGSYRAEVINYFMVLQVMMKGRRRHSALRVTNSQKEKRREVGGEKREERLCSQRWGRKRAG